VHDPFDDLFVPLAQAVAHCPVERTEYPLLHVAHVAFPPEAVQFMQLAGQARHVGTVVAVPLQTAHYPAEAYHKHPETICDEVALRTLYPTS
jgi:hypothetical protein